MKYLLDVNILLAAVWSTHPQHARVCAWLADKEIVLCPIAELGFIRISTHRKASIGVSMPNARQAIEKFSAAATRIPDDLPPLESHPRTSDQVADRYLADLATKHQLKLATLDISLKHPSAELVR